MTAKKILHMHFGKEGGAERFFVSLVRAFADRGMEQHFIVRPGRLWREEIADMGPIWENNFRRLAPGAAVLRWRMNQDGPSERVETTGTDACQASRTTLPKGSWREGMTKAEADAT